MDDTVDMSGFYSDPWSFSTPGNLFDSPVLQNTNYSTDYSQPAIGMDVLPAVTTSTPPVFTSNSPSTNADWLKTATAGIDYGLKVMQTGLNAKSQYQDQSLNAYLKTAQVDIARVQAGAAMDVAKLNATTAEKVATLRANAANTGAVAADLGRAAGNNSIMLWLTIAGVALAFVQVMQSGR
ncbi:hypothetical protein [uncultured Dechloromonas sp.]|uniref:hypothetical protein n=1 Tax=uncultured Dechloromonas sp. TaxID=171719 RepID=UPI0025F7BD48|nr:hypothetical protein [uncultured Dechloromonas sp.]